MRWGIVIACLALAPGCKKNDKGDESAQEGDLSAIDDGGRGSAAEDDAGATGGALPPLEVPAQVKPVVEEWWKEPEKHCPEPFELTGAPPPDGTSVWCAHHPDGATGPQTTWHQNGAKRSEGWQVDGEKVGPWRYWHDNGQPWHTIVYLPGDGQTGTYEQWDAEGNLLGRYELPGGTGTAKRWYENGELQEQGEVVGGRRTGVRTFYREDGTKRTEWTYRDGVRHGPAVEYDDKERKRSEGAYVDDERHGRWTYFDSETGAIQRVRMYVEDSARYTLYYQDGELLGEEPEPTPCDDDDGLSKLLEAETGDGLSERYKCVTRPDGFPGLILVGSFAHDRGCMSRAELFDCELREDGVPAKEVLARAGWKQANRENREAIAMRYIDDVDTVFSGSTTDDPEEPKVTSKKDGSVVVELWVARPSGMRRGRTIDRYRYRFADDGTVTKKRLATREENR